jgi:hypothetical protein
VEGDDLAFMERVSGAELKYASHPPIVSTTG